MRILLIEDEMALGEAIRTRLSQDAHAVDLVGDLASAVDAVRSTAHELVLLDLNLPGGSGMSILTALRRSGDRRPVLIITAADQLSDRLAGLNAGADDYIVKPFHLDELAARVEAVHRRHVGDPSPTVKIANVTIDKIGHQLWLDGVTVPMTAREWALLIRLADRPGSIVSKAQLEDALYRDGAEIESNTVEVYVSRLRRKLGRGAITTVRGLGYRLRDR